MNRALPTFVPSLRLSGCDRALVHRIDDICSLCLRCERAAAAADNLFRFNLAVLPEVTLGYTIVLHACYRIGIVAIIVCVLVSARHEGGA